MNEERIREIVREKMPWIMRKKAADEATALQLSHPKSITIRVDAKTESICEMATLDHLVRERIVANCKSTNVVHK